MGREESVMELSQAQIASFHEQGYLFLPDQFTPDEIAPLRAEAHRIFAQNREEVWRETNGAARTAFAAHTYSEPFRRLGAHPRLIRPVMQLLDGQVYIHQFKINAKAA